MKKKNLIERERERERKKPFFVLEKYIQNGREWQIYTKMMRIRRAKIKEDEEAK